MTELCVCVCGSLILVLVCVCVCECVKKILVVISLQRICRIPCRKEESVSVRFLTGNRKKKLCVQKFCSTAWGTVTRIEPGNDCKKNFTCIGRRHLIDVFQKEKGSVSLRCEPNGRTIETVLLGHGQAPFVWKVTEPAYSQGKVGCSPFEFGFCLIGAPAAL